MKKDSNKRVRQLITSVTLASFLYASLASPSMAQTDRSAEIADQIEHSLQIGILALAAVLAAGKAWLRGHPDAQIDRSITLLSGQQGNMEDMKLILISLINQQINQAALEAWCAKHQPEMDEALDQIDALQAQLKLLGVEDATVNQMVRDAGQAAIAFSGARSKCR